MNVLHLTVYVKIVACVFSWICGHSEDYGHNVKCDLKRRAGCLQRSGASAGGKLVGGGAGA